MVAPDTKAQQERIDQLASVVEDAAAEIKRLIAEAREQENLNGPEA